MRMKWLFSAFVVLAMAMAVPAPIFSMEPSDETILLLSNDVLNEVHQYVKFKKSDKLKQIHKVSEKIQKRKAKLISQLEKNPEEVMRYLLPPQLLETFPKEIRDQLEMPAEAEGEVQAYVADYFEEGWSKTHYALKNKESENKEINLHFSKEPAALVPGTHVRIKGMRIDNHLLIGDEEASLEIKSPAPR